MHNAKRLIRRLSLGLLTFLLAAAYSPAIALAEEAQTNTAPAPTASSTPQDPTKYQKNEATGTWENSKYSWDPATHRTTPKHNPNYSYNPATGAWDTTTWRYSPEDKKYVPNTPLEGQNTGSMANNPPGGQGSATTTSTVPANQNSPSASTTFDGFYNPTISNNQTSTAQSGDAAVSGNTIGGNASSGNALAASTIFNLLQSSSPFANLGNVTTFSANINGDVRGDFYIDPAMLKTLQPASSTNSLASNIRINNVSTPTITNDLRVAAQSGNASVNRNTTAGDATTGNADAVANLVNLLNSSITAGQSFVGQLNITGNFNGDILLPPGALNALLAAGGAPGNVASSTTNVDRRLSANLTNTQAITNNVTLNAMSGAATVADNTTAGNAATGSAKTNLTLLNLTGHDVVAADSLLVFVNVLGKWLGAIVNAPAGTTSAALAGNVSKQTALTSNTSINSMNDSRITNNLTLDARSGDADVSRNTHGGSARSGNATASANIANISKSDLALSDWFGVLFINVFGLWNGSFGVNTSAGDPIVAAPSTNTSHVNGSLAKPVFRFSPTNRAALAGQTNFDQSGTSDETLVGSGGLIDRGDGREDPRTMLFAQSEGPPSNPNHGTQTIVLTPTRHDLTVAGAAILAGAVLVGVERLLTLRDRRLEEKNR